MKERVIFRHTYDPYMKMWKFMCIFPDEEVKPGNVCYVDIWKDGEKWWRDVFDEIDIFYTYKHKIIHKKDPVIPKLIEALKGFYGGDYIVVEKITYKK